MRFWCARSRKLRASLPFFASRTAMLACAIPALLVILFAVSTRATQQPAQSTGASTVNDEAARAAERKRRFEEQKRRLEQAEPSSRVVSGTQVSADQTLFVSPSVTNMLVGDFREFCVFDIDGKILTRQAEWTIDDSGIATLNDKGEPTITAKQPGKATLRARIGSRSAEASVTVLDGSKMPDGTIKWSVPNYPGYKSRDIVQAVPTNHGPDLYTIEENDQGESLVRAWTSEGIFLWLRKSKQRIIQAVPH
jgi:hypothetical protein